MQIHIQIDMSPGQSPSKTITLQVTEDTTVNNISEMIEKQENIFQMNQHIIHNMEEIMGNRALKHFGIVDGSTLLVTSGSEFRKLQIKENRKKGVKNQFKA
jgi:hypothetical protein